VAVLIQHSHLLILPFLILALHILLRYLLFILAFSVFKLLHPQPTSVSSGMLTLLYYLFIMNIIHKVQRINEIKK